MAKTITGAPEFALSVSLQVYDSNNTRREIEDYLCQRSGEIENIEQFNQASREIRQIVESKDMPEAMKDTILSSYDDLCRKCDCMVAVSTRSAGPVSHPGQYETYLNVKGKADLLEKIKRVWASSFNPRSLAFRKRKGLPLENDPIGVAVLKMVNARAAGIVFTADPNTGDTSKMIIEANWGLGESVVSGELMPDVYVLNKQNLK
jgi:pyruvate,water dikinase